MDVFGDGEGVEDFWGEYGWPTERGDCDPGRHTRDVDLSSGHVLWTAGQSASGSGLPGWSAAPGEGERLASSVDRASTVAACGTTGGCATMHRSKRGPGVRARRLVLDGPPSVVPRVHGAGGASKGVRDTATGVDGGRDSPCPFSDFVDLGAPPTETPSRGDTSPAMGDILGQIAEVMSCSFTPGMSRELDDSPSHGMEGVGDGVMADDDTTPPGETASRRQDRLDSRRVQLVARACQITQELSCRAQKESNLEIGARTRDELVGALVMEPKSRGDRSIAVEMEREVVLPTAGDIGTTNPQTCPGLEDILMSRSPDVDGPLGCPTSGGTEEAVATKTCGSEVGPPYDIATGAGQAHEDVRLRVAQVAASTHAVVGGAEGLTTVEVGGYVDTDTGCAAASAAAADEGVMMAPAVHGSAPGLPRQRRSPSHVDVAASVFERRVTSADVDGPVAPDAARDVHSDEPPTPRYGLRQASHILGERVQRVGARGGLVGAAGGRSEGDTSRVEGLPMRPGTRRKSDLATASQVDARKGGQVILHDDSTDCAATRLGTRQRRARAVQARRPSTPPKAMDAEASEDEADDDSGTESDNADTEGEESIEESTDKETDVDVDDESDDEGSDDTDDDGGDQRDADSEDGPIRGE
ncbi:hypothetical protein CBR_g23561 [Chara braunii]|uniref:Uncharacterized protein n=1 Tax=Chara braunii TaxID=69332 RepID=A0A388L4V6_CHABU|nr:hypothetical protein CBR_g23561 [Chara braunii]|eukprot:GBG77233.1 hypothetical protein CBR_g23561 [Chara braunii]